MTLFKYLIFVLGGYLSGSILFGYFIPKVFWRVNTLSDSDDLNPGTANSFKLCGVTCGIIVLILELIKGFLPIFIARNYLDKTNLMFSLVMIAPVIGHAFPLYFAFKNGGKCIAVSFGILLGLLPNITSAYILVFWLLFFSLIVIIKPHALRVAFAYSFWMFSLLFFPKELPIFISCMIIGCIVIFRHIKSIKQIEEREVRFAFKKN